MNRSIISSARAAVSITRKVNCRAFMARASDRITINESKINLTPCMRTTHRYMASENVGELETKVEPTVETKVEIKVETKVTTPILIYEGKYSTKLRFLRIVSLGSSLFCCVGLPLGICFTGMGGTVPIVGQVLIGSTAALISISSTTFLQLVTHPYTVALHEMPQILKEGEVLEFNKRQFRATRYNLLGKSVTTDFCIKDADRTKVGHPFASVKIKGLYFYIFGRHMSDVPLRHALTTEE